VFASSCRAAAADSAATRRRLLLAPQRAPRFAPARPIARNLRWQPASLRRSRPAAPLPLTALPRFHVDRSARAAPPVHLHVAALLRAAGAGCWGSSWRRRCSWRRRWGVDL